jgi:hypothetical protein
LVWAYLVRAIQSLREQSEPIEDEILQHFSPLGWEHINLTGDYVWPQRVPATAADFRPLRSAQTT